MTDQFHGLGRPDDIASGRAGAGTGPSSAGFGFDDSERVWLRAARRSQARRNLLLALLAVAVGVIGILGLSFGPSPEFLRRPQWPWLLAGGCLLAAGAIGALAGRLLDWAPLSTVEEDLRSQQGRLELEELPARILPFLRDALNKRSPSFQTTLEISDAPGLGEVFDPFYEIPVSATERLKRLIDRMPGGSIGVSGPRGAGKTTLIRSFCHGSAVPANASLSTMVSAPVEYTARDFVLHLFATLCQEALGLADDQDVPPPGQGPVARLAGPHPFGIRLLRACGPIMLATGAIVLVLYWRGIRVDARIAWGAALVLAGAVLLGVAPPTLGLRPTALLSGPQEDRRDLLRAVAAQRLREIRFQQTVASGWSGTAKAPVGLEASVTGSSTLARVQLSFPEIVTMLRGFLTMAAKDGPVVVGIDELDKLPSDEKAHQFLNEIKAIFGIKNCFFLISISEEAMASFERRGLPFRDVFDSSFDEVVEVPYLSLDDAQRLLNRRVVIPMPFLCLCYCLSGGLARDLIRAVRNLVEQQQQQPDPKHPRRRPQPSLALPDATQALLQEEVRVKTAATVAAFKTIDLEPETSELLEWCRGPKSGLASAADLLKACRWFTEEGNGRLGRGGHEQAVVARQALYRWVRELASFYCYAATMLECFDERLNKDKIKSHLDRPGESGSFEQLATCRQAFAINPRLAWTQLSAFRPEWSLSVIEFPAVLLLAQTADTNGGPPSTLPSG